jgi:hypothetical protein
MSHDEEATDCEPSFLNRVAVEDTARVCDIVERRRKAEAVDRSARL